MEFKAVRLVPLSKLRLPGNFKTRLREPRCHDLSHYIQLHAQWIPILVRSKDGRVLDGLDRVAAMFLGKWSDIWAVLIDCTDEEADYIEANVNHERRHDVNEKRHKALELVERETIEAAEREADEVRAAGKPRRSFGQGRPATAKGQAIKKVAAELGVKPATVRQAAYRQKRKEGRERETRPLNTLGMTLPDSQRIEVTAVQRLFDEAATRISQALACLTTIESQGYGYPTARLQRLRSDAHDLAASLRNNRPEALCPYCKSLPPLRGGCPACVGHGIVMMNQMTGIPKALLDESDARVMVSGELRSAWDYITEEPPPPAEEEDPFGLGATA